MSGLITGRKWALIIAGERPRQPLGALSDAENTRRHLQEWTDGNRLILQNQLHHTKEIRMISGQNRKSLLCFRQPV